MLNLYVRSVDPCCQALKYFKKIQRKNRTEHGRWDCETRNYEIKSEKPADSKKLTKKSTKKSVPVDKATQYGEDNPDEDFYEGALHMAMKILDREARTQNVEMVEEKTWEYFASKNPKRGDCMNEDCENWSNCDGVECRKTYCDRCGPWSRSFTGCDCPCATKKCICYGTGSGSEEECDCDPEDECYCDLSNSEPQTCLSDNSPNAVCDSYNDCECDCDQCNCAENQKLGDENYQKYLVWRSQTPGELVEELAEKIIELRGGRYVPSRSPVRSVSPRVQKYGPDGVGPWGY